MARAKSAAVMPAALKIGSFSGRSGEVVYVVDTLASGLVTT